MRIRLTTHLPIEGTHIGPTVWWGSISSGWIGKPLSPRKWNRTYRVYGVPADAAVPASARRLRRF